MKLYAHTNSDNGSHAHRLFFPFRYLKFDYPQHDFFCSGGDPLEKCDAYFLNGLIPPANTRYIMEWKVNGGAWVYNLDDDYSTVPEWNKCKLSKDELLQWHHSLLLADVIVVSTEALKYSLPTDKSKVIVAPNLMEVDTYRPLDFTQKRKGPIKIMWSGSHTHDKDIEELVEPLDKLLRVHREQIEIYFVGCGPGRLLRDHLWRGVNLVKGVPFGQYPALVNQIQPDIVLAPLNKCVFNLSKCVTGDTLVPTKNGIKTIKSLVESMAKSVTLENKEQMIRTWFTYKDQPTIKIETKSGYTIEGTPHHRVRKLDGSWIALEDLKIEDEIEISKFDIKVTDYQTLYYPLFKAHSIEEKNFDNVHEQMLPKITINENWGRFLGYVLGDGYIGRSIIGVSCSTDYPDIIADVKRIFSALGINYHISVKKDKRRRVDLALPKGVDIKGCSKQIVNLLHYIGMADIKSKIFEVPQIILNSPKSVIREFLRGLFEADSGIAKNSAIITYCTKSEKLARQIQILLLGFGIKSKIAARFNGQYNKYYWYVSLSRQGCDIFLAEIGYISQRKQDILRNGCNKEHSNAYKEWLWSDPVVKIEKNLTADVYDIEVAHEHYYLANGFVSHNSNIRVQESWALQAATVATNWGEYGKIQDEVDGLFANNESEWYNQIDRLICDEKFRQSVAASGRERVLAEGDWANPKCREPWRKAIRFIESRIPGQHKY